MACGEDESGFVSRCDALDVSELPSEVCKIIELVASEGDAVCAGTCFDAGEGPGEVGERGAAGEGGSAHRAVDASRIVELAFARCVADELGVEAEIHSGALSVVCDGAALVGGVQVAFRKEAGVGELRLDGEQAVRGFLGQAQAGLGAEAEAVDLVVVDQGDVVVVEELLQEEAFDAPVGGGRDRRKPERAERKGGEPE